MPRLINGKPIRERGTNNASQYRARESRPVELQAETHDTSMTAVLGDAGKYYQCFETDDFRQSRSQALHLGLFKQKPIETIAIKSRQLGHTLTGDPIIIEVTDQKVLRMSDRTLLNRGIPFQMPDDIKRSTSRSKRITHDPDTQFKGAAKPVEIPKNAILPKVHL